MIEALETDAVFSSVRAFLLACPLLAGAALDAGDSVQGYGYALDAPGGGGPVRRYLDGAQLWEAPFSLYARQSSYADTQGEIRMRRFFEDLENWLRQCSRRRLLPALRSPRRALALETAGPPAAQRQSAAAVLWRYPLRLLYLQGAQGSGLAPCISIGIDYKQA